MEVNILSATNTVLNKFVAEMRDVETQKDRMRFRKNIERIGSVMAYEVSKKLAYEAKDVRTPLGTKQMQLPEGDVVVGSILRAGLPMHQGVLDVFDHADNCFATAYRAYNEKHEVEIHLGYAATPNLDGKILIMADPMLATGYSMHQVILRLLKYGTPRHIHILSIIGAQKGIDYLAENLTEVPATLWVADADPILNADSYIVPGLGDAGDLAYGEKL